MIYKKFIALVTLAALVLSGCSSTKGKHNRTYTDTLFDTVISVEIFDGADKSVLDGVKEICVKYDAMFSTTNPDSEVSRINQAGGAAVEVSNDTIQLIKKGIYYSELSGGAFDITIAPVVSLWDFKAEAPVVPAADTVLAAASHVDYKNIMIKDNTVMLADPASGIDLGAVAKGFIADKLKAYLEKQGIRHALINLGGNVLAIGSKPDGTDYNIGIQKPFDESGASITSVKISDGSIVTSGIYQRYFEQDGTIYHHILDPATGVPCQNNLYSVTIITDSSLTADALSTTCFLLGLEKGMQLIDQLDNVDAVFITNDNEIHYSANFQQKKGA